MIAIQDPTKISGGFPYLVLSNQRNSWIGKLIDFRTDISGPGMFPVDDMKSMIDPQQFVMQGLTFAKVPMTDYLIPQGQLWFVQLINSDDSFVNLYRQSVLKRLALPFFLKSYDFLGIFGQAIGQPWIHTPFLDYCSVDVLSHLKYASIALPNSDRNLIQSIPNESNPEYITQIIVDNPKIFNIKFNWNSP